MNQINLEKLLQQAQAGKTDSGSLKLLVAQVYQAQVQQLTDGGMRLQLPQPGGALQLNLPATVVPQLQQMLSFTTTQSGNATAAVLLQFQPLADGRIQLSLQNNVATVSIPLNTAALHQVLVSTLQPVLPLQITSAGNNISLTAVLATQAAGFTLQLANLPGLTLSRSEQQQLSALRSTANSQTHVQLLLQLPSANHKLTVMLSLPPQPGATPPTTLTLSPPSQNSVIQQLVRLFNQQQLPAQAVMPLLAADSKAAAPGTQVQLSWPAPLTAQPKLQLISAATVLQLATTPEQFNRPIQLTLPALASADSPAITALTTTVPTATPQATLQHAWRQLLPLLAATPAPLASLPELPAPVQQLFQLVRHSQLDGSKVWTPAQLQPQLAAALAFQPLQSAAPASSSGTLAVAIQLLLGHLLQKPTPPTAATPAMARLISQLEPAQASTALRQLASHSSTLQQSQLATLDSANNQQLILQLPLQQGQQSQFCQLMLEQREADGKQQDDKAKLWQLTLRFDLKQHGAMMVVAKLSQQQLKLQFYTEQLAAKQLTERFLPILKDRCTMQGIQVEQADCVLGIIPPSLVPRANSLLAIKA